MEVDCVCPHLELAMEGQFPLVSLGEPCVPVELCPLCSTLFLPPNQELLPMPVS